MRVVRFEHAGRIRFGVLGGDSIEELQDAPFEQLAPTGGRVALEEATLLPPVMPPTFYAAGINYANHVRNAVARGLAVQMPTQADIGYR
ncbi:MAG TPA: DUF2437 domain-containing protein, partial [Casimicrobiaceae bacterium]|nr:DUF2437 domain-containing protein [Casimicrobiaceae bacterium]